MRKGLGIVIVLALLAAGGWYYYSKSAHVRTGAQAHRLVTIMQGDLREQVTAQGKLEAKEYVDVGTQVSGQIQKIYVQFGDDVKAGQSLAEIDPRIYQSRVDADEAHIRTLQAQLAQQQAQLKLAEAQNARNVKLIKKDAVSQDDVDQSVSALKVAEANVAALKAEIEEAQSGLDGDHANLTYTHISAPMAGTVVDIPLREGQTVNASQSAPTIMRVSNLDVMTVRAQVAEADVMRLKAGMEVYFTTMGDMDRKWTATVRQILPTPEVINDVVLYDVLVDAENKDRALMSGMSTQVFFTSGAATGVPLIPVEALTRRKEGEDNAYIVKVAVEGGRPEERVIHTGVSDRTMAEVKDGLKVGDKIVLPAAVAATAKPASGGGFRGGPRL